MSLFSLISFHRALLPTDVGLFLPKTQHCEIKLEIKHSSYKKTSAFLKHLQSYGLLTLVNDRIVSVNRQHEYFRDYKDHIRVENSEEFRMHVSVSSSNEHNASHPSKTVSDPSSRLKIIDLFKFPRPIREVLVSVVRNGGSNSLKDLEDHLSWLMGEGPYGECMIHSEVQWLLSSYVAIQNLQDPANRGSLIIPTTDPLYMHLTRIKGIHKEDPSTIRNDSELRENPETNLPELSSPDEDEPPVAPTQGYDQPYEMVGGVLVTPLCRENNQATSRPTLVEHDPETIQHTPAKWKPVTLPPAPPPNVRVAHPTKVHKKEKTPSEPVIQEDLHLTKEDLMYRLRNALIPYHAILLPTGL